jgi:hypothetical protein
MRLWSIHPKYLDSKGLVALWREALLANKVLEGGTIGYKNHPQLNRFKESSDKIKYIKFYLHIICDEADRRGYSFDRSKVGRKPREVEPINVKTGQIKYEVKHLLSKLKLRDPLQYKKLKAEKTVDIHPLFRCIRGGVESWEVVSEY